MGWVAAVASVAAAQQAGAVGKYNQAVQERNAVVAEQEKERLEQQLEFDLARLMINLEDYKVKLKLEL